MDGPSTNRVLNGKTFTLSGQPAVCTTADEYYENRRGRATTTFLPACRAGSIIGVYLSFLSDGTINEITWQALEKSSGRGASRTTIIRVPVSSRDPSKREQTGKSSRKMRIHTATANGYYSGTVAKRVWRSNSRKLFINRRYQLLTWHRCAGRYLLVVTYGTGFTIARPRRIYISFDSYDENELIITETFNRVVFNVFVSDCYQDFFLLLVRLARTIRGDR